MSAARHRQQDQRNAIIIRMDQPQLVLLPGQLTLKTPTASRPFVIDSIHALVQNFSRKSTRLKS